MNIEQFSQSDERLVREYDYEDETVLVADLGIEGAATVDVVDGTAIVVVEAGGDETQFEVELPRDEVRAFIKNGVLTVEMEADNE